MNSSKVLTPKKRGLKSKKSTPKKSGLTPSKNRSPRSSRTLPMSPISQTMRQSSIPDFFKPISPSIETKDWLQSNSGQTKTPNDQKITLSPIFGSLKRNSVLKTNSNLNKKIKTNKALNFDIVCDLEKDCVKNENILFNETNNKTDILEISENEKTLYFSANDLSIKSELIEESCDQLIDSLCVNQETEKVCDKSLNQLMDKMTITRNAMKRVCDFENSQTLETNEENKEELNCDLIENKLLSINNNNSPLITMGFDRKCDDNVLDMKLSVSSDEELEPIFKVPKPVPKINVQKLNNKYIDKEKRNQLNYVLKNLKRITEDREMLDIEPICEYDPNKERLETELNNEEPETQSNYFTKPVEGIDILTELIPNILSDYSIEAINSENLLEKMQILHKLPANRFVSLVPLFIRKLNETERQLLVSYVIKLVLIEENDLIFKNIETKTVKILCSNRLEISLSSIIRDFYQILYNFSSNLKAFIAENFQNEKEIENKTEKMSHSLSKVLKVMTQVLDLCSFKLEGISIEEELIKLLSIAFSLSLENRLIQDYNWLFALREFIAVIMNYLDLNELNIGYLIKNFLSSIYSNENININLCLHIVSMIPLDVDFILKRQLCGSVLKLYSTDDISNITYDLSLDDFKTILETIDWENSSPEKVYDILRLINTSLDLPKDLLEFKVSNHLVLIKQFLIAIHCF